jgi:hypothetical protein
MVITKLCQYGKWLLIIICVFILTRVDKVTMTTHMIIMRDDKKYLKPNINA